MITIQNGKLTIPENERFIGFAGDNLRRKIEFSVQGESTPCELYRIYLTFDDGTANYFTLESVECDGTTTLVWDVLDEHIFKSGLVKVQIKAFSQNNIIWHTNEEYFVVGESSECDDFFKNKENSEFLRYEQMLNTLKDEIEAERVMLPYIGENGNWYLYDAESDEYIDSGKKSMGEIEDYSITPEKLSKNYVEYSTAEIRTYGDLDAIIGLQQDDTLFRVEVSGLCAFRSTLGEGYFTAVADSNRRELTLKNHSTGGEWLYREFSEELIPLVASSQILDNHIAEVNEKGGIVTLTDPQLDALDNLFDLTAYTSDKGKDAYEAFVKAFGLDNYRVQREFTIDELFPCGLSYLREANITGAVMSEYGYYTKQGTNRYSYIYFDIPCKYGYTYKFDFETTQSTDNIAIELYNEYALNQVEAEGDYRSADHKEYNWIGNGGEVTPPELINGFATAGLRFVFNTGTPGVTRIKISKKRVL